MDSDSLKKIGIKKILKYVWKKYMTEKLYFILLLISRIAVAFIALLPALYYKQIIDLIAGFLQGDKSSITIKAISILIIILLIKIVGVLIYRISDFLLINLSPNIMRKIYLETFDYTQRHSFRFFTSNFTGALIKKINKFVGAYDNITDIFVFDISSVLFNSIFVLIIVSQENLSLSVIFIVWIVVFIVVQYFLYKWNYPYEVYVNGIDSKLSGLLSDTITNNFNIKTFASLKREIKIFDEIVTLWRNKSKIKRYRGMLIWGITGLMMVGLEFVIFYFAIKLRDKNMITIGVFVLLQLYIFRIIDQMWSISHVFRSLYKSFGEMSEMMEILDEEHEIKDTTNDKLKAENGKIEINNINFTYGDGKNIFENLNLKIKSGEKIAIVGQSGSGKTTIIKLLFRFFDIQGGEILIDGQNISSVTQESLRGSISMVAQDPILFHRSLKENISYGNPHASKEEIIAASKMARCHEFIMGLKDGYDTLVGERGIKLSGGERQRVAIARAILENKNIIVLDEATSSLDSESEKLIQDAMDEVLRNKTAIVIAHRLSTIMKMDRIIVMDNGKIIESGSHKELLSNTNSMYKKFRDIQSGGFIE
ncbi:MAG: ABC transporter ATP-binding protein [Candidatus Absconditicoccaceae bacterium]